MGNNKESDDGRKTVFIKNPIIRQFIDHYASFVKRHPVRCAAALLAFIILLFFKEDRQAIFDFGQDVILFGGILAVFGAIALGLSKIFNPKTAALIAVSIFVAALIGMFIFIIACWGGGC